MRFVGFAMLFRRLKKSKRCKTLICHHCGSAHTLMPIEVSYYLSQGEYPALCRACRRVVPLEDSFFGKLRSTPSRRAL